MLSYFFAWNDIQIRAVPLPYMGAEGSRILKVNWVPSSNESPKGGALLGHLGVRI